jgi:UDP-N-acetylmuramoyl-tripeptide--D-alanyl-D-alanine ligase
LSGPRSQPGDLFVALKDVRDGHDFVGQALEKGAAAALVSRVPDGLSSGAPLLVVPDVLKALEDLGRAARARAKARVVGVTGSVGKTSTKEMLRVVLGGQGRVHAAEASYNNHWGVPLTLARLPREADFRGDRDRHEPSGRDCAPVAHGAARCGGRDHGRPGASGSL